MRRLALGLALLATPAAATDLVVVVHGVSAQPGTIMVAACGKETWPGGECRVLVRAPAHAGDVPVLLTGVPEGTWAVKVFHDRNGNLKLDTNWMGVPAEPVAFGNDAPIGRFGPPSFEAAAIVVPPSGRVQTAVTLRYKE